MCRVVAEVSVQRGQASFARRLFIRAGEQLAIESPGTPLLGVLRPLDVVLAWAQSVLTYQAGNARRHGERHEASGPPSPSVS
jgi:hypothetical protein